MADQARPDIRPGKARLGKTRRGGKIENVRGNRAPKEKIVEVCANDCG